MRKLIISFAAGLALCAISCTTGNKNKVEIKVISYNIRQSGLSDKDGEYKWENRKEATLNMIQKESPSVY
ncbi:hypothetical protein AGMMS50239_40360 [Bacteroidia bacterium]|nr:hypothetical protein AGMMS50239_40360 [Bacteroidia bacterium]